MMDGKKLLPILLFLILIAAASGTGIGASPGTLEFKDVLRGGYAERTVLISNPDETAIQVSVAPEGDVAKWLSFSSDNFDVEGKSSERISVYVRPPEDVQNGVYNGRITVTASPKGEVAAGMGAVFGAGVAILTSVNIAGEQRLSGKVSGVKAGDAEVGDGVPVSVGFTNTGNVAAKPLVGVSVFDAEGKAVTSAEFGEKEVLPTKTEEIRVLIPTTGLAPGRFWAEVEVMLGGEKLALAENRVTFEILEQGALKVKGELEEVRSKPWAESGEAVRIDALFANTGEKTTSAKFKGEVRLGERIVGTVESDELVVEPGDKANLSAYFTPKEEGKYVVEGAVVYSKRTTGKKSAVLNVMAKQAAAEGRADVEVKKEDGGAPLTAAALIGGERLALPALVAIPLCCIPSIVIALVLLKVFMEKKR